MQRGFTLIELSIVLVIIGLIVGGVLVGRDFIKAAEVRAQITQIQKLQAAVNTFYGKYQAVPGDADPALAARLGLPTHVAVGGWLSSDDGLIMGADYQALNPLTAWCGQGNYETGQFWTDLSSPAAGQLIEGNFSGIASGICATDISPTSAASCLPSAKIGAGRNFISIYSDGTYNWFGLGGLISDPGTNSVPSANALTPLQAYNIDKKIDDGLPGTGNVVPFIVAYTWYTQYPIDTADYGNIPASATSCYDNGNGASNPVHYSITTNNGSGLNCVLSFKLQ